MLFRFRYLQAGGHTHVRVFAGVSEGALGKCGDLTFRNEEWEEFKNVVATRKDSPYKVSILPEEEGYGRPLLPPAFTPPFPGEAALKKGK